MRFDDALDECSEKYPSDINNLNTKARELENTIGTLQQAVNTAKETADDGIRDAASAQSDANEATTCA